MLLELKDLTKYFPVKQGFLGKTEAFVHAVNQVSLKIEKGQSLALVGESGCGKTTLSRVILKLIKPTAGQIIFDGENITDYSNRDMRKIRHNMQFVFQDPYSSLDPRYTIRKILKEAMCLQPTKSGLHELMVEAVQAVGLKEEVLYRYPHEFSGGERQRIAIARALILKPKFIILDEAVSSLDVLIQEQIVRLLNDLKKQYDLTYLFVTHNLKIVKKICQNVAVMYKGKIIELGTVDQIFQNPIHPYTQELLKAAIEYKTPSHKTNFQVNRSKGLQDQGDGHLVLE
ncbi:MAG: ABC transporter ATP-binding protein [Candidatus Omnitrophica bacterium]|nr:ABC transporter ATP-binding protein [Candidatus Omnitrophota bacterium]